MTRLKAWRCRSAADAVARLCYPVAVILASQLKAGQLIRYEGELYRVLSADYHGGQGKMGGVTHARLEKVSTKHLWEHTFRADEKLEEEAAQKKTMEFLYSDEQQCYFMDPETFEQIGIPTEAIGKLAKLLQPQMAFSVEFLGSQPLGVRLPDVIEVRVAEAAPPTRQSQDTTWKLAVLEGGLEIKVPLFIKPGELIRIDTHTLEYRERAKT
jgi:elongation factor P